MVKAGEKKRKRAPQSDEEESLNLTGDSLETKSADAEEKDKESSGSDAASGDEDNSSAADEESLSDESSDESSDENEASGSEEDGDKSGDSDDSLIRYRISSVGSHGSEEGSSGPQSGESSQISEEAQKAIVVNAPDEYDYDSSDEEDIRNTVGNIPMEWYKNLGHIGYDLLGEKILQQPMTRDKLDEFISKNDNPNFWRTVTDRLTGEQKVLSDHDVNLLVNFMRKKYVEPSYDPYEPWVDFNTHEKMIHPVTNRPEHKRSFIPSLWEKKKVGQIVHAIKMGWIKPSSEKKEEDEGPKFFDIWKDEDEREINRRFRHHIPAPKRVLPGHAESYAPPPEYLFSPEEEAKWREQPVEERRMNFIPHSYSSLRRVPAYPRFVNEQFERCLDLYLCARQRKMRMNVNVEDLIPKLPKPKDLQPFPTTEFLQYKGHSGPVRCISIDTSGRWLASGSEDCSVRIWDVVSGRCWRTFQVVAPVKSLQWHPHPSHCLLAAAVGKEVIIIVPRLDDKLAMSSTEKLISSFQTASTEGESATPQFQWSVAEGKEAVDGIRLKIAHPEEVSQVVWHPHGDYFAAVMKDAKSRSVVVHQLNKRKSQYPFKNPKDQSKGQGTKFRQIQCVLFHPTRPLLFYVATQQSIRVYNFAKHELTKKLYSNCQWLSSMAIHPKGDDVITGSYDKKLGWFDTELSNKPYQTMRHHKKAIRQVCFHKRYPLFASASDDGTVLVSHGKVFDDMLQNPLIVPVKILRGHAVVNNLGVLDCQFHPSQPYIFTAGADSTIRLFTNV